MKRAARSGLLHPGFSIDTQSISDAIDVVEVTDYLDRIEYIPIG